MKKEKLTEGWMKDRYTGMGSHQPELDRINKILQESGYDIHGPLSEQFSSLDMYHVANKEKGISATLFVSTSAVIDTHVTILGSKKARDLVSRTLKLRDIEEVHCKCGNYWCRYTE